MKSFTATIHHSEPFQVDGLCANTASEVVDFVDEIHTGTAPVTITETVTNVVATKANGEWVTRKVIPTTDELVKKLWVIADGVGQRDSLDTFAQLASLILLLERK